MNKRNWVLVAVAIICLLAGCATRPALIDALAADPNFKMHEQQALFKHVVVEHLSHPESGVIHIYIEGDGIPWRDEHTIAADPTPRKPLALALMTLDTENSIYLGRPCYFSARLQQPDTRCDYHYWTDARYASAVIDSMTAVANRYIEQTQAHSIAVIGYSGGAVLATMLADRLNHPVQLITLSGNLNVEAWTRAHNYSPLTESVDPFIAFEPRSIITHHHYVGADDSVVPPAITASFTTKFQLPLTVLPGIDHSCCWEKLWPQLLQESAHD